MLYRAQNRVCGRMIEKSLLFVCLFVFLKETVCFFSVVEHPNLYIDKGLYKLLKFFFLSFSLLFSFFHDAQVLKMTLRCAVCDTTWPKFRPV